MFTLRPLFRSSLFLVLALLVFSACKKNKPDDEEPVPTEDYTDIENTLGFGVLSKVQGIWNGAVTSTTPLGGFPEWIVDFRAISANQVSAKNELDPNNDIFMSFFIAKYNGEYRVCFRNGGSFAGQERVSYFLADSVSETASVSYYRFSEVIKGKDRAFTEVICKSDSLIIKSYTNNYNTQMTSTPHMTWRAKLQDATASQAAASLFGFPQKTLTKDFSTVFDGLAEAMYFNASSSDPYPESQQPYLGVANISFTHPGSYSPDPNKKVYLYMTTQPLYPGGIYNPTNLKYRSRYVVLSSTMQTFQFNYMHPGTYYVYAFYDADGNYYPSSGDWVSIANTSFTLGAAGTTSATAQINFNIP